MQFSISSDITQLNIQVLCFTMYDLHNIKSQSNFTAYRASTVEKILATTTPKIIAADPILQGFRALHTVVGKSNRKFMASPENLLHILLRTGSLPSINLLVDIYNLVSVQTHLALGAHDSKHINGNVTLRLTNGTEQYHALGKPTPEPVPPGEYAYIDDSNELICRLEYRQVEKTKITLATTNAFFIVQGNSVTTAAEVERGASTLIKLVQRYCGGQVTRL